MAVQAVRSCPETVRHRPLTTAADPLLIMKEIIGRNLGF